MKTAKPNSRFAIELTLFFVTFSVLSCLYFWSAQVSKYMFKHFPAFFSPVLQVSNQYEPTEDTFDAYAHKLKLIVDESSPKEAFIFIESKMETNQYVNRNCHSFVHVVGHEAYEKYGGFSQALPFNDDLCGSGYLHGVIESKFDSVHDLQAELNSLCTSAEMKELEDTCFHGIGHGLMNFSENDLPYSLELCQTISTDRYRKRCAEGVFMENFSITTDSLHPTKYLRPDDLFYPCADQIPLFKDACYFYSSIYYLNQFPNAYVAGLEHCMKAEGPYRATCAVGMGSRLMKENTHNVTFVQSVCDQGPALLKPHCFEGVVSWSLVSSNSVETARNMCTQLTSEEDQAFCATALEQRAIFFSN